MYTEWSLAETNGKPKNRLPIADAITGEPMSAGYAPSTFMDQFFGIDGMPSWTLRFDIPLMLTHPMVCISLNYYKSGISGAEFDIKCDNSECGEWLLKMCNRFWDRGVPKLQRGYDFGWVGCENVYAEEEGIVHWDSFVQFSPRDTYILTQNHIPVGVRVKHIKDKGTVDLWLTDGKVPAKGIWYSHNPVDGYHYGRTQLYGAWRPWRRVAWKDGAETVLDGGVYRLSYAGPIIKYPDEDLQAQPGIPATTNDSQGRPRRYSRDMARQIGEQFKTGATVGLPSKMYPPEQGGGPKWDIELPKNVLNVDPIMNYVRNLYDQIAYGIGVPPELIQSGETGSGYSGRRVPLEAFLDGQQKIADQFLHLFVAQVLEPLVALNWGPVKFEAKVKRLLETKNKANMGEEGANEGGSGAPGAQEQTKPELLPEQHPTEPDQTLLSNTALVTDRIRDLARKALLAA